MPESPLWVYQFSACIEKYCMHHPTVISIIPVCSGAGVKLARFERDSEIDYGFIVGGMIVPHGAVGIELPQTLDELAKSGNLVNQTFLSRIQRALAVAKDKLLLKEVRLLHPVERPGKIICLGRNYLEHALEGGNKPPKGLMIFLKPSTALTGPYDPIIYPSITRELDYEGELAVLIGKTVKSISREEAYSAIAGFMIMNDVSARDIQLGDKQWTRGKGCDTFAPIGPWITTKDEVPWPPKLYIKTWVNEELRQDDNTSNMLRKVDEVIAHLSEGMTLEAGDIISTGTPQGVGYYMKPYPRLLNPGDRVRVEIERLGYIENTVRA
ncbi:MAG: fumarylacetoacetate hydrolase family protein [Conexivisphaerales archaeon]